ncbi:hypothetical protein NB504_11680 [Vibrio sp. RM-69-4]|nr:hypothetical protein [Vibrio sp. RM-69-4]
MGGKLSIKSSKVFKKIFRVMFPEFSNKVTWLVVGAGIGLTSTSIIVNIIDAFTEKQFNFSFVGPYDPVVGTVLIAFGLIHNYAIQRNNSGNTQPSVSEKEAETLDELHRKMLTVEGLLNKSFLDRRLWNEIQENLDLLKSYYFENKLSLTNELDELSLELIMVGRKVLSASVNERIPPELVSSFRSKRENIVVKIRMLKGNND